MLLFTDKGCQTTIFRGFGFFFFQIGSTNYFGDGIKNFQSMKTKQNQKLINLNCEKKTYKPTRQF